MVFGGNGLTDMEALHAQYGAQLDASDADFTQFAVWNDANSNGVVDANELHSLSDAGITSISLVSDGNAYSAAGGDVQVAGTATYTKADGSTGDAADAIFSTGSAAKATQEVERVAANSNSVALAAAVAAAGLAAAEPLAAKPVGHDGSTDPVVSAVAANDTSSVAGDSQPSSDAQSSSSALVGDAPAEHANAPSSGAPSETAQPAHDSALDVPQQDNSAPAELLQGTDAPAQAEATANPFTAQGIQMPAADQLVGKDGGAVAGDNVQHNAVVGQVLADALNGGDSPHIEAALNAVTGGEHAAQAANDALASHGSGAVSNGDMPDLAAFIAAHGVGMVAPMEMHHDAPAAV
jgi:hypothetical protein